MMRLVVVEDHPIILKVISMALRSVPGYEVVPCQTAEAGLAACDAGTDLAIFDNRLPDLTGIEAVQRLRAQDQTRHLPVIVITGDSDKDTRLAAIKAGATDFLEKPVLIDELRLRVRNLLDLHAAQKQASQGQALLETLIAASGAYVAVADAQGAAFEGPGTRGTETRGTETRGTETRGPDPKGSDPQGSDTPVIYVSAPLAALGCGGAAGMLGRDLRRLWATAPPSPARAELDQAVAARRGGRFVLSAPTATGEARWVEIAITPVADVGRPVRHLVVRLQDVTDLVETRQAHHLVSARLADIARISGAWFFELDADLRLSYLSAAMARMLGIAPERVLGLSLGDLSIRRLDPTGLSGPIAPLFAPPHQPLDQEIVSFRLPDGQTRAVQVSATPFLDDEGRFAGYRGHAGDVSEIARARDLAAQASRAKSVFLANMSHEMRTPLTAIIGLSEALSRDGLTQVQQDHVAQISASALRLADVLSDVLDAASMEQGRLSLRPAPFDPVRTALQALAPLRATAESKGLTFDLAVLGVAGAPAGTGAATRLGDAGRVARIIQALASNAVKFTAAGRIEIRLDLGLPDRLGLSVADTGIGMAPGDLRAALSPFVQADDGIARRFEGTGLGLSIVQWLTEAMGGTLDLQSTPGAGTLVRLSLPLPVTTQTTEAATLRQILPETPPDPLPAARATPQAAPHPAPQPGPQSNPQAAPLPGSAAATFPQPDRAPAPPNLRSGPCAPNAAPDPFLAPDPFPAPRIPTQAPAAAVNPTYAGVSPVASTLARAGPPLANPPPPRAVQPADLSGLRVLVADDNLTNRKVLETMLAKMGAQVTLCVDGTDALDQWRRAPFDLLLLDINMPTLAGTDVIRTIRNTETSRGLPSVPAVAVTANARPDQVALYLQAGFDDCVAKPFTSATLSSALCRFTAPAQPAPTAVIGSPPSDPLVKSQPTDGLPDPSDATRPRQFSRH